MKNVTEADDVPLREAPLLPHSADADNVQIDIPVAAYADTALRRQTEGSRTQGKIGIKVACLEEQNERQFEPVSHEIRM